ncbi:hypothetical protein DSUL_50217 [Desulfovibrionales bacterium]
MSISVLRGFFYQLKYHGHFLDYVWPKIIDADKAAVDI